MKPRRVLLLTHERPGSPSGNQRALIRFAEGLRRRGLEIDLASLAERDLEQVAAGLGNPPPDLIHGMHAYHAGRAALRLARLLRKPIVITVSGTDLDQDIYDPERRAEVLEVLRGAAAVTVATRDGAGRLRALLPDGGVVFYAPKGIAIEPGIGAGGPERDPPLLLL